MAAWIPITLMAALAQTLRFMLQKHLTSTRLGTRGATLARFLYSAPVVVAIMAVHIASHGQARPVPSARFLGFALAGGLFQIFGTLLVVALFGKRNFAVGVTFMKTEVLLAAGFGFLVLGDAVGAATLGALVLGLAAVVLLSPPPRATAGSPGARYLNAATGMGLASGACFAVSAVFYRAAALALVLVPQPGGDAGEVFLRAGTTLAVVTTSQSLLLGAWLAWRAPAELRAVLVGWRLAGLVGLTSLIGSFCWFLAFALQSVVYVKALGQIEVVLGILASVLFFGERICARELAGIVLMVLSILLLLALSLN